MKLFPAFVLSLLFFVFSAVAHDYHHVEDWLTPPAGMDQIGDSHGEIDVDSKGLVYVSVTGGDKSGIQVYSPGGKYLRNVPNARANHHGFTIVKEGSQDVIYASCLRDEELAVIKLTTKGKILLEIENAEIPDEAKTVHPKRKEKGPTVSLTHIDVAPNGDMYVVDGYQSDRIYVFDSKGNYKKYVGGKEAPHNFDNAHKVSIDKRFSPARLLVCDRKNLRLVHLSLDGDFIGEVASDLKRPSAVAFYKDFVAVAEINGRVSILDKAGKTVRQLGASKDPKLANTAKVEPRLWETGVVTSPHGIAFDKDGNVLMTEWNKWGRVLRWDADDR